MTEVDPGFWRGRGVLVTGHTGFKGAWLSLWLHSLGARVTGFSAGEPEGQSLYRLAGVREGVQSVSGDLCDTGAIARAIESASPEVVIHMAAQSLVRRSYAEPRETFQTNVMGTLNLLEAVRSHGEPVRAVVCVTSDKCYENRGEKRRLSERDPLGGDDPYSSSKACAELVTAAYRHSFFGGARVASARAGNVIGGGDWAQDRLVPDIMRGALAGGDVRVRNPSAIRPWQHVLNPLSGYLVLAQVLFDSAEVATSWNFGPAEEDARSVEWLVREIVKLWPDPLSWGVGDGAQPPEAQRLELDSSQAHVALGWRPPVALQDALQATVAWYRALRDREDMRAVTLAQIDALAPLPGPPGAPPWGSDALDDRPA